MNLDIEFAGSFCTTTRFTINGVEADADDFGRGEDMAPDEADDYACANMVFTPRPPAPEVLAKYSITPAEYLLVAEQLRVGLSFGCCGLCS